MQKTAANSFWSLVVRADDLLGNQRQSDTVIKRKVRLASSQQPDLKGPITPDVNKTHFVLATNLTQALASAKLSHGDDVNEWNTLVTQSTVPELLRSWTLPAEGSPRIRWERPQDRIDANLPVSCVRILGMAAKGTWAQSDKRGDPLLSAAIEAVPGDVLTTDRQQDICRSINQLHDAARIWLMAREEVHVVSPQAWSSIDSARTEGRTVPFYGGAEDGAHTEIAAMVQNWIGGRPDSTMAWVVWNLSAEVGTGAEEVKQLFAGMDVDVGRPHGSTLRTGQDAFGGGPAPPPRRQPRRRRPGKN